MRILAEPPRVRSVVDATTYFQFADFCCGEDAHYEYQVNTIVGQLHRYGAGPVDVRVAEASAGAELIGVCGSMRLPMLTAVPGPSFQDAAHIKIIGLCRSYRGVRAPDGTRLGEVLLRDALARIELRQHGEPMPPVWAIVALDNDPSHRLFASCEFELIETGGPYDIRLRPRGLNP